MIGAEELFRYDPSRTNDKILGQLQRYRDDEIQQLRLQGERQAQAKRESLQNVAAIPNKLMDAYEQGSEENRRQRQQALIEEQDARQKELHPLEIETRKSQLERNKFGLSEEQKQAQDAQRQRDLLTTVRPDGLTNEQYAYNLNLKAQEQGIAGQKAQISAAGTQAALAKEQILNAQEERKVRLMAAEFQLALQSNDPNQVAQVEAKYGKENPALITIAKSAAAGKIKDARESANFLWTGSDAGKKTMSELHNVQNKAKTLAEIKSNLAKIQSTGFESNQNKVLKQNIIAQLNRPEMGPEGQNAASLIDGGFLGLRFDSEGFSGNTQRLQTSLKAIESQIEAELKQIELQNGYNKVPAYHETLQNTWASFRNAQQARTDPPAPDAFGNQTNNTLPKPMPANLPPDAANNQNTVNQQSGGRSNFRRLQSRGNP